MKHKSFFGKTIGELKRFHADCGLDISKYSYYMMRGKPLALAKVK